MRGWGLFLESGRLLLLPPIQLPPPHPHIPGARLAPSQQAGDRWAGASERTCIQASGLKGCKPRNLPSEGVPAPIPAGDMPGEGTEAGWVSPRDKSRNSPRATHMSL